MFCFAFGEGQMVWIWFVYIIGREVIFTGKDRFMDVMEKLQILSDAAKYDVACTSSGSDRKGMAGAIGNSVAPGICHTFSADGRCISLLTCHQYLHLSSED